MRWLTQQARSLDEARYQALHADLDRGSDSARHTGLQLAIVRADVEAVSAALQDPLLGRRALAAAARMPVPDAALEALLDDAPKAKRLAVYGVLRQSRRRSLAAGLIPMVLRQYGPADVMALLPACAPGVIAEWLPRVGATGGLRRLARVAPNAVLDVVVEQCGLLEGPALVGWSRRNDGLAELIARRAPEAVIAALSARPHLGVLVRSEAAILSLLSRPDLLVDLDPARTELGTLSFSRRRLSSRARHAVAALAPADTAKLLRVFRRSVRAAILAAVPPSRRREVVDLAYPGDRLPLECGHDEVCMLPPADRSELVPRIMARHDLPRYGWPTLRFLSALPFAEARTEIAAATTSIRYQERRVAWPALLQCATAERDPEVAVEVLRGAGRAWHDQDHVRAALLEKAAALPVRVLAALPVDVLQEATSATTGARDTSGPSLAHLLRWVHRTVAAQPDGARVESLLRILALILADARCPATAVPVLPPGSARLWPLVREKALRRAETGRPELLLRLARLMRADLPGLPDLADQLGSLALSADAPEEAIRLWVHPRATREDRVARLVARTPAAIRIEPVWTVVATRRTDLLDAILTAGEPLPGTARQASWRWTDTQRARASASAATWARDPEADLRDRIAAARLVTDPGSLAELADTAPEPIAAAALGSLARSADAMPILFGHTRRPAGPASRAAVRALRTALAGLPDSQASEVLRQVLRERPGSVGAAKEAIRLLADLRPAGAADVLIETWTEPDVHRDVRVVLAEALVRFIADPRVPPLLADAIRGAEEVRTAVLAIGAQSLPPDLRAVPARLMADALDLPDETIVADVLARYRSWWRYAPEGLERLGALATVTVGPKVFHQASTLLITAGRQGAALPVLTAAVDALATRAADRDPVACRRLADIADRVTSIPEERPGSWPPVMARLLAVACRSAGLPGTATRLLRSMALRTLFPAAGPLDFSPWGDLIAATPEQLHRQEPRWNPIHTPETLERVRDVVAHLETFDNATSGLLAVELLARAGHGTNWDDEWRTRLATFYDHADLGVREAALTIPLERQGGIRPPARS